MSYLKPLYDREKMIKKTKAEPTWVHFGYGNIFRAFHCRMAQKLLNEGEYDKGIIAVEGFDEEIVTKVSRPIDDITVAVTFMSDNSIEKEVVASVAESLTFNDWDRLQEVFTAESLQMVTFTITEKGYTVTDSPDSYMGKVTKLLYERYKANKAPVAIVSMDNCSKNGDKLKNAISAFATTLGDTGFIDYVEKTAFPWTMIDKITPRPSENVLKMLEEDGFTNMKMTVTGKNTYIAPFVNGEECEYLIIEDNFPMGHPPIEKCGVVFTSRDEVSKAERIKVTAALNPLHTALAVYGCVLGYTKISDEMKDIDLVNLIKGIAKEGLAIAEKSMVLDGDSFAEDVLTKRLPNPYIPDTPQRIATDTSQKLSIRFGETIKAYKDKAENLEFVPFAIAGWLIYLDTDKSTLSPDPLLDEVTAMNKEVLLTREDIFGVDLYKVKLADKILSYYNEMKEKGVHETLHKYMEEYR